MRHQSNSPPASLETLNAWLEHPRPIDPHGPPPARVRKCFRDWDKPLVPPTKTLKQWSLRDVADWTKHWPPSPGRLFTPLDVWDDETAAIWLRDSNPPHVPVRPARTLAYRAGAGPRRTGRRPPSVLLALDDDEILDLTDRVLCERLRRQVIPDHLLYRVEAIKQAATYLPIEETTLDEVRRQVYEYDGWRREFIESMLADCYDRPHSWIPEWVCDLFNRHVDLYDWPPGFSWSELCRSFSMQEGMIRVVPCF